MAQDNNTSKVNEEVVNFNFKDFFNFCLTKWYWFFICVSLALGISLFYLYRKQPEYKRYEQILVNEQDSNGGMSDISNSFSSLGLFSKNTNVYNELLTITSPSILYSVADTLQLYMNYTLKEGLRYRTLYGSTLPFRIDMLDMDKQESGSFRMTVEEDGSIEAYKFVRNIPGGKKIKYKDKIKLQSGTKEFESPLGKIRITPNPSYLSDGEAETQHIRIGKMAMQNTVELYGLKMNGDLVTDDADVIELSIIDVNVQRAMDILNYILLVYNQNWVTDKNRMAIATSSFIDERLKVIEEELGEVDQSIADYMKKTGNPDMKTSIQINLDLGSRLEEELINASNKLSVAKYMSDFLNNPANNNAILPVNLGIEDESLGIQVTTYNDLLLARNNILNNSSAENPLVINYDRQLTQMKKGITVAVDNQIKNLQQIVNNLKGEMNNMKTHLSNSPSENLPLLSEERQQEVKEALYLFLLQKREENVLTMKYTADNVRIITPPIGPLSPVAPRRGLIVAAALIMGFGFPLTLLYLVESNNTKVRSKNDLSNLLMSFAGEIPQVGKKTDFKKLSKKVPFSKSKDEKPPLAVVEEGKRDVVNEAFRVVRGNIDFMSGKKAGDGAQVIMLTSFNPGSGKSFIAYNLAMSYCLKNKKVLVIDCDLRHGSSSMYVGMPSKGLALYLTGHTDDWQALVVKSRENANLSIMPIGKMPPNPAELLENGRLGTLIEQARKDYDVIFLDCPPVNIVVDTQIVSQWADRTLFVVRAGLLEKSALKELNEFYEEKKFKNMSVILNGTEAIHSRYYTYGNYQNLN